VVLGPLVYRSRARSAAYLFDPQITAGSSALLGLCHSNGGLQRLVVHSQRVSDDTTLTRLQPDYDRNLH
jgi:hypothetical protein